MHVEYHDTPHGVNGVTTEYHAAMDTFAEFVRTRREALGMSGVELAIEADLTKSEVSAIENGRIKLPGADKRRRLAEALRIRHVDLLVAAGELSPDEVPGPSLSPRNLNDPVERLADQLAHVDLTVDRRASALAALLDMFQAQDRTHRSEGSGPQQASG
jgi:transcriptional regulator with XRE-family HTH domain